MITQAAVHRLGRTEPVWEDVELESPRPGELLVELLAVGVCHTDLAVMAGRLPSPSPIVLGHEGCGTVLESGPASRFRPGDRVVLSFAWCGHCRSCRLGTPAYCSRFRALNFGALREDGTSPLRDGAGALVHGQFFGQSSFARHCLVAERSAVAAPSDVPPQALAPMSCSVQTGVGAILRSLRVYAGSSILVLGAGSVGLAAIAAARAVGAARIVAVDVLESRRELARAMGATDVVDGGDAPIDPADLGLPDGLDFALDTTGQSAVISAGASSVRAGGTIGLASFSGGAHSIDFDLLRGHTFVGINSGNAVPSAMIPDLVELRRAGLVVMDEIVTTFPWTQLDGAIDAMRAGSVVKPVILMS